MDGRTDEEGREHMNGIKENGEVVVVVTRDIRTTARTVQYEWPWDCLINIQRIGQAYSGGVRTSGHLLFDEDESGGRIWYLLRAHVLALCSYLSSSRSSCHPQCVYYVHHFIINLIGKVVRILSLWMCDDDE